MKIKGIIILFCVLSLFTSLAMADEASHRAAAEELLMLTNVDKTMKSLFEQIEMASTKQMEQQFLQSGAPEELRPVLKNFTNKMRRIFEEILGWENLKNDYIDIYVRTYTEDEIKAISEFYKTPAGQRHIEKMPKLMEESAAIAQKIMPEITRKMDQLFTEMDNEIEKLKKQSKD